MNASSCILHLPRLTTAAALRCNAVHGLLHLHLQCSLLLSLGLPSDAGMELYPRIGKRFDIKTWTNCRMGMMGWAVLITCFAIKQHDQLGHVSHGLAVSMLLMQLYIFKFFL